VEIYDDNFSCIKNWSHSISATGSNYRLAGRLADKIVLNSEIIKVLYWTKYSNSFGV